MRLRGPTVMLTIELPSGEATLEAAREALQLDPDDVDDVFGLVPIDPAKNLYVIVVTQAAGARVAGTGGAEGPHANPPIEPFGPPQDGPV